MTLVSLQFFQTFGKTLHNHVDVGDTIGRAILMHQVFCLVCALSREYRTAFHNEPEFNGEEEKKSARAITG